MGVTPLMWAFLDKFASAYKRIWSCPLEWDNARIEYRMRFLFNPFSPKLIPYFAVAFVLLPTRTALLRRYHFQKLFTT